MQSNEVLMLQALKYKQKVLEANPELQVGEGEPAWMHDTYDTNGESRNICGMIPKSLFDEVERISAVLSISKRALIEMALRDMAINANKALDDVGFVASSITHTVVGSVPVDKE